VHVKARTGNGFLDGVIEHNVYDNRNSLYSGVPAVCYCTFSCAETGEKAYSGNAANGRSSVLRCCIVM
jgi:hypothetical protein